MKNFKTILLLFSVTVSTCIYAYNGSASIVSGGITRTFLFHSAGSSAPGINLPVMFVLHGDGGTGASVEGYTGMDAVADANNFIAVYPDAIASTWNRYADNVAGDAGLGDPAAPDDVLFISDVIDYFCSTYHINSGKVYASGHSAGGFMAYNLAVQLPNKIAAIAPVSASLWGENAFLNTYFSTAYVPMPVYHIHGDADLTVDYPDANGFADAWGEWPLSGFSYPNCGNNTYISTTDIVAGSVKKLTFCTGVKEVLLIDIVGGGHGWPSVAGYNPALSIWNFCNAYSISTGGSCAVASGITEAQNNNLFTISPNPSNGVFTIAANQKENTVKAYTAIGSEVSLTNINETTFAFDHDVAGIYFIQITTPAGAKSVQKIIVN
jgi:poly(3-hydroxybutyrate) depolymerase